MSEQITGIDDSEFSIPKYSPICAYCANALASARKCKAFSGLIPLEIWRGNNDHTRPYPGDNGMHFEPIQDTTRPNA